MFRVIKESENVDERQHCFLIQAFGKQSHYFSVETRQVLMFFIVFITFVRFTLGYPLGVVEVGVSLAQGSLSRHFSSWK